MSENSPTGPSASSTATDTVSESFDNTAALQLEEEFPVNSALPTSSSLSEEASNDRIPAADLPSFGSHHHMPSENSLRRFRESILSSHHTDVEDDGVTSVKLGDERGSTSAKKESLSSFLGGTPSDSIVGTSLTSSIMFPNQLDRLPTTAALTLQKGRCRNSDREGNFNVDPYCQSSKYDSKSPSAELNPFHKGTGRTYMQNTENKADEIQRQQKNVATSSTSVPLLKKWPAYNNAAGIFPRINHEPDKFHQSASSSTSSTKSGKASLQGFRSSGASFYIGTHGINRKGGSARINPNVDPYKQRSNETGKLRDPKSPSSSVDHITSTADDQLFDDEDVDSKITWEELSIDYRIGLGSDGEVFRAKWKSKDVAVKRFMDHNSFKRELRIMRRLHHGNIVRFMGAVICPPNPSIITKFIPRGNLYRILHRPNCQIDKELRISMALDVARAMNYLHTSKPMIVHRDLKSPNLLVDEDWSVKVCDFGLSELKDNTFLSSTSTSGTPEWIAPELLCKKPSNEKCDVFSFGVILWELATLRVPWEGMNRTQVIEAVCSDNRRLDIPKDVDSLVAKIIQKCWQNDPEARPSFAQLIAGLENYQQLVFS
ncbi:hypothetical protein SLA2020_412610 [Shorea laevis]